MLYPDSEEIPCGFRTEKGYRVGAAPVSGVLQKPGCGRHYGGIPGVYREEASLQTFYPQADYASEGTGAESRAPAA